MPKLQSVLQKYAALSETGRQPGVAPPPFDPEPLKAELKELIRHNERFFWVWIATLLILFALGLVLVVRYIDQPVRIQQIFTATGISFFGVVWRLGEAWKTKMALEFTITLVGGLNEDAIRSVVTILAKKIKI